MRRPALLLASLTLAVGTLTVLSPVQATISPTPATMGSVSAGATHTVVIGADGKPYGVGANDHGQLTGTDPADRTTLTPLAGLPAGISAVETSAGYLTTLVLGSDHIVYGTGSNSSRQLTGPSTADITTLTPLTGQPAEGVARIFTNGEGTLVLSTNGTPYVTGLERSGRFGGTGSKTTLTALTGLPAGVTAIDGDISFENVYLLGSDHQVYASGGNFYGQGPGAVGVGSSALIQMPVHSNVPVTAISAGDVNVLALGSDGNVYGAGQNANGEVGQGGQHNGLTISPLTGLPSGVTATAVSAGDTFSLVIGSDGRAYGTGDYSYGQQPGRHSLDKFQLFSLADSIPGDVTGLSGGSYHSVFTDADGIVYGAGNNADGQVTGINLGDPGLRVLEGQQIVSRSLPSITGTPQFTKTLTATPGTWSPTPSEYAYQWKQDGLDIAGATGKTYAPSAISIGGTITVTVTAKRGRFLDSEAATSSPTAPVAKGPALVYTATKPTIIGTAKAGKTLKISKSTTVLRAGFNPDATTLTYRWYRSGTAIGGATSSTYKLSSKDKGRSITVRISGTRPSHTTGSYLTKAVKVAK